MNGVSNDLNHFPVRFVNPIKVFLLAFPTFAFLSLVSSSQANCFCRLLKLVIRLDLAVPTYLFRLSEISDFNLKFCVPIFLRCIFGGFAWHETLSCYFGKGHEIGTA
jgi:hypothetical protein